MPNIVAQGNFTDGPCGPRLDGAHSVQSIDQLTHLIGRLGSCLYPILELCVDAYNVFLNEPFCGSTQFIYHVQGIRLLLREGGDIDAADKSSGGTALHFAAGSGCKQLCGIMLSHGARSLAKDRKLRTPFWWAMAGGHASICRMLLKRDGRSAMLPDIDGITPLHEAASLGILGAVKLLVPFYARGLGTVDPRRGPCMRTPLHVAAAAGDYPVCVALLKGSADPSAVCCHGKTALHYAAEQGERGLETCNLLGRLNSISKRLRDASGRTPIEAAARHGELSPRVWKALSDAPPGIRSTVFRGGVDRVCRHIGRGRPTKAARTFATAL
eukprot:TRINITY_DN20558_c0_g1_i1.p1 TRINITY_DN20558_c0_g1~~TRINITY_DN20558_c0_g1_i1.p1  ORF type:complete len:327 (-),score=30.64 TRINITY_DN20558_c0_g1_i1:145-1125(-)